MKTKSNKIGKNISALENNLFQTEIKYKLFMPHTESYFK